MSADRPSRPDDPTEPSLRPPPAGEPDQGETVLLEQPAPAALPEDQGETVLMEQPAPPAAQAETEFIERPAAPPPGGSDAPTLQSRLPREASSRPYDPTVPGRLPRPARDPSTDPTETFKLPPRGHPLPLAKGLMAGLGLALLLIGGLLVWQQTGQSPAPPPVAQAPAAAPASGVLGQASAPTSQSLTPRDMFLALRRGDLATVKDILSRHPAWANQSDEGGLVEVKVGAEVRWVRRPPWPPLHLAVYQGSPEMARLLVTQGAQLEAGDKLENGALQVAAFFERPRLAQLLIGQGARVDQADGMGQTPLMVAARRNALETARVLIKAGARLDLADRRGATALHLAARENLGAMARLLVQAGAPRELKDGEGLTPEELAQRQGNQEAAQWLANPGSARP